MHSWDSIFNAQRNEEDTKYISTQREKAVKSWSTNAYISTEEVKNGEDINISDGPTPDPSTSLLMTGPGPTNAESSANVENGPSVRCLLLCGLFIFNSLCLP